MSKPTAKSVGWTEKDGVVTMTEADKDLLMDWLKDGSDVALRSAVAELFLALIAADQKPILVLRPRTKKALSGLARAYNGDPVVPDRPLFLSVDE